jgi:hypothetical protein
MRDATKRTPADGFVQIGALAGLAIVAALVTAVLSESVRLSRQTEALDRVTRGAIAADSGIRRLLVAIDSPADALEGWVGVAGVPYPFEFSGLQLTLAIEGEAGKINPLSIAAPILAGYIENLAIPGPDKAILISLLEDARSNEDTGAAMDALHAYLIPALSSEDIARDFTTRSRLAGIDPQLASERVLRAVPDVSDAEAAEIVRGRARQPGAISAPSAYFATGRPLFTLVAAVRWTESESFTRRVPIELTTAGRAIVLDGFR